MKLRVSIQQDKLTKNLKASWSTLLVVQKELSSTVSGNQMTRSKNWRKAINIYGYGTSAQFGVRAPGVTADYQGQNDGQELRRMGFWRLASRCMVVTDRGTVIDMSGYL